MTPTNGSHPTHGAHPVQDPRLVALGRELERATRRLTTVEALTGQLDLMLRQLAADIALLVPTPDETDDVTPPVRSWLAADDPAQASADLAALIEWVHAVYVRYPGGALPSCWLWQAGLGAPELPLGPADRHPPPRRPARPAPHPGPGRSRPHLRSPPPPGALTAANRSVARSAAVTGSTQPVSGSKVIVDARPPRPTALNTNTGPAGPGGWR